MLFALAILIQFYEQSYLAKTFQVQLTTKTKNILIFYSSVISLLVIILIQVTLQLISIIQTRKQAIVLSVLMQQYMIPNIMKMKKRVNLFIQTDNEDVQLRQPSYLYSSQNDQCEQTIEPLNFKRIQTEQRIEALPADRDYDRERERDFSNLSNLLLDDFESQSRDIQQIDKYIVNSSEKQNAPKKLMLNVESIQEEYQNKKSYPSNKDFKLNFVTSPKIVLLKNNETHKRHEHEKNASMQNKQQHTVDSYRPTDVIKANQGQRKKMMQFKNISMAQLKKQLHQAKTIIKQLKQQPKVSIKKTQKSANYSTSNPRNLSYQKNVGLHSHIYTGHTYGKYSNAVQNSKSYRQHSESKDSISFSQRSNFKKYLTLKDFNAPYYRTEINRQ